MIVSYRWRFVFVKAPKAAGTAIEVALSPLCGDEDVFTHLTPPEPGHTPRNAAALRDRFKPVEAPPTMDGLAAALGGVTMPVEAMPHLPAWFLAAAIPDEWEQFFTFAVSRNPWDRIASGWYHHRHEHPRFDRYLPFALAYITGAEMWCDRHGNQLVDRVLRYDRLEEELAEVTDLLGMPRIELPRAKAGLRTDAEYRHLYDDAQRELVAERYAWEIERFGYTF